MISFVIRPNQVFYSDGQQLHNHQQNELPPLTSNHWTSIKSTPCYLGNPVPGLEITNRRSFTVLAFEVLRSPSGLAQPQRTLCITNDHGYVPCPCLGTGKEKQRGEAKSVNVITSPLIIGLFQINNRNLYWLFGVSSLSFNIRFSS